MTREKTRDGLSRRQAILTVLDELKGYATHADIRYGLEARGLVLSEDQLKSTLYGMSSAGEIENVGRGEWRMGGHVQKKSTTAPAPAPTPTADIIGNLLELVGFDSQGRPLARTVDNGHTVYRLEAV